LGKLIYFFHLALCLIASGGLAQSSQLFSIHADWSVWIRVSDDRLGSSCIATTGDGLFNFGIEAFSDHSELPRAYFTTIIAAGIQPGSGSLDTRVRVTIDSRTWTYTGMRPGYERFMAYIPQDRDGVDYLTAIAQGRALAVDLDGFRTSDLSLRGSRDAMIALMECRRAL
jgi:hypothetical protein